MGLYKGDSLVYYCSNGPEVGLGHPPGEAGPVGHLSPPLSPFWGYPSEEWHRNICPPTLHFLKVMALLKE